MKTEQISPHSYAAYGSDGTVFTLSNNVDRSLDSVIWNAGNFNWEQLPQTIGNYKIVPWGADNRLPSKIRDIVADNNLVPGIIERQAGLLFGQGLFLNRLAFENGQITHYWESDAEIQSWLNDWDYVSYIKNCITDYLHLKGFFDAKYLTRAGRLGKDRKIAYLEHIPAKNARLEWTDSRKIKDVKHILVGNFENGCIDTGISEYPVYDRRNPGRYPVCASYNHTASFARDFYSVPQFWGALRWIVRGSEIPTIFKYVTDNGLNLAYHIHSTSAYWDSRREILRRLHEDWTDTQVENEIGNITRDLLKSMTEVLTGKENAGKFFHTVDIVDDMGHQLSWKIEAIDQKIKDFVESQLKISEASVSAITSGMGLHPSLSNIMVNGKLASGSELLYAFKLYLASDVEIASQTILEPINQAISFNFPGKDLRLAFYHKNTVAEEAVTSSARVKNQ